MDAGTLREHRLWRVHSCGQGAQGTALTALGRNKRVSEALARTDVLAHPAQSLQDGGATHLAHRVCRGGGEPKNDGRLAQGRSLGVRGDALLGTDDLHTRHLRENSFYPHQKHPKLAAEPGECFALVALTPPLDPVAMPSVAASGSAQVIEKYGALHRAHAARARRVVGEETSEPPSEELWLAQLLELVLVGHTVAA